MIQIIKSYSECRDFVSGFQRDTNFADPMLSNEAQGQNTMTAHWTVPGT